MQSDPVSMTGQDLSPTHVPHPSTKASSSYPHLDCAWAAWGSGGALAFSMASPGSEWTAVCTEVTASALHVSSSVSLHLYVS